MSIIATVPVYILNNEALLWRCLGMEAPDLVEALGLDGLRDMMMLDYHHWHPGHPDQVPLGLWNQYIKLQENPNSKGERRRRPAESVVLDALECLYEEYLEEINGETYVQMHEFGWWQNMLSHLSPLPLQAYAEVRCERGGRMHLHPYEPSIEGYIRRNGLHDTHLHLKLCSSAEECWLQSMRDPGATCRGLGDTQEKKKAVAELLRQIHPKLDAEVLFQHLLAARAIRRVLIHMAYAPEAADAPPGVLLRKPLLAWREEDCEGCSLSPEGRRHIILSPQSSPKSERAWMAKLMRELRNGALAYAEQLFHIYLLLMHEYRSLYTQCETSVGFRQFQKTADCFRPGVGNVAYYSRSFCELHGYNRDSATEYVNARIAPKEEMDAMRREVSAVLTGYLVYLQRLNHRFGGAPAPQEISEPLHLDILLDDLDREIAQLPPGLRTVKPELTLHFIKWPNKSPDKGKQGLSEYPHFHEQRQTYKNQCKALTRLLEDVPPLRHWIRAVDAAASELDTPPYVFAPVFRAARDVAGIAHQVFHAGEDFPHLVSGIRAVYETATHLDMRQGDRIGHATALGIAPALWLASLPNALSVTIGGWLQDLVFAWNILSACHDCEPIVAKLDRDIRALASRLFQHAKLSPHSISQVMDLRQVDPVIFQMVYHKAQTLSPFDDEEKPRHIFKKARGLGEKDFHLLPPDERELRIILGAVDTMPDDVLHMAYHWHYGREVYQQGREYLTVPTDYFSEKELLTLQQEVAKLIRQRGVVLETLPTSNVRISQYQEMRQHHALRWLGVPPFALPGDSPLIVTVGDDDPGVFATNIKNEFYHLFISMKRSGLNSGEALQKVIELNENGANYAFRPLNHTSPDPRFPRKPPAGSHGEPWW